MRWVRIEQDHCTPYQIEGIGLVNKGTEGTCPIHHQPAWLVILVFTKDGEYKLKRKGGDVLNITWGWICKRFVKVLNKQEAQREILETLLKRRR